MTQLGQGQCPCMKEPTHTHRDALTSQKSRSYTLYGSQREYQWSLPHCQNLLIYKRSLICYNKKQDNCCEPDLDKWNSRCPYIYVCKSPSNSKNWVLLKWIFCIKKPKKSLISKYKASCCSARTSWGTVWGVFGSVRCLLTFIKMHTNQLSAFTPMLIFYMDSPANKPTHRPRHCIYLVFAE